MRRSGTNTRQLNLSLLKPIVGTGGNGVRLEMRMSIMRFGRIIMSLSLCMACSSTEETSRESVISWHQDIKPIFDAYCNGCHSPEGIAPFALDTLPNVREAATLIPSSIVSRRMPPFLAAPAVRPLKFDQSLSDAQIHLVTQWIELGMPEGDPNKPGVPIALELMY